MQLLNVTNDPVELGVSPFFQGQDVLLAGVTGLQLQGSNDGSTGWTSIGSAATTGVFQLVTLSYPYIRVSTAATMQLINN